MNGPVMGTPMLGTVVKRTELLAGVITTPTRQMYLGPLIERLAPVAEKLVIFNDTRLRGHTWNYRRALTEMLGQAAPGQPVLICTDDMITVPDWKRRWEVIHTKAKGNIYSLFSRKRNLFTEDNLKAGWVKGIFPRGFYDAASIYIDLPTLVEDIDRWMEAEGHRLIPPLRQKHMDVVVQDYFVHTGREWVTTTPSLFEHVGEISTMKHKIGGATVYVSDYENQGLRAEDIRHRDGAGSGQAADSVAV